MSSRSVRSRWLMNGNRKSLATVRIVGLNLQGKPQKASMSIFSFGRELQTTIFIIQFSIGVYSWTISKTFDELREFHNEILLDSTLRSGREYFTLPFPAGKDGETDTMILVERREMIEALLKEIFNILDFERYEPLYLFMEAERHLLYLRNHVRVITNIMRSCVAKNRLNNRLFRFYSQELVNFMYTMEAGIEVYNIDEHGELERHILWLDVCEEPGLSRVCLAPKNIHALPKQYEDERLANGIFLSDIAEVRKGASSHAFRSFPFLHLLRPELCVCIVGSERTLSVQFILELLPATPAPTEIYSLEAASSRSSSPVPPVSAPPTKPKMIVDRIYFVDMLNLMSIQSLPTYELKLRNRKFVRCAPHLSVKVYPNHILTQKIKDNASKLLKLLTTGIEVDEETFSPYLGIRVYQKNLQYDPENRKLLINSLTTPSTVVEGSLQTSSSAASEETTLSSSPLLQSVEAGKELQNIVEVENEDDDDDDDDNVGHVRDSDDSDEFPGDDGERTSSSSQSSMSQRNTLDSLHNPEYYNNPPAISIPSSLEVKVENPALLPQRNIDLSHLKFDLTTQNRSIDIDDICEVRPGKVSPLIDGTTLDESDALYVSIIASESILVLPVPSLAVRNNLIKRFQAFLLVNRDYSALDSDTPIAFRKPNLPNSSPRRLSASFIGNYLSDDQSNGILNKSVLTFNSPAQSTKKTPRKQKNSGKKSKKSTKSSGVPASLVVSPPSSTVGVGATVKSGSPTNALSPGAPKRGTAAPIATLTSQMNQFNNRHIYSHTKQTRSVSIVRRSSNSSRGQSSINESFHSAISGSRTTSMDV